jgi:hypothetical protein
LTLACGVLAAAVVVAGCGSTSVPADHQLPKSVLKELQATDGAKYVVETGKESYPWPAEVWYRIQGPDPSRMEWETAPHRRLLFATIGHLAYIVAGSCYEHGPLNRQDFDDGVSWAIPHPPAAATYSYSESGSGQLVVRISGKGGTAKQIYTFAGGRISHITLYELPPTKVPEQFAVSYPATVPEPQAPTDLCS